MDAAPTHGHATRGRAVLIVSAILLAFFAYDGVVRPILLGLVRLPNPPGELTVMTSVLALFSLAHAWYSTGGRLTAAFFCLSAAISWAFEQVGVATGLVYGAYHYTDYLGAKLGHVPLLIPLAWFMMIYPSFVIAKLLLTRGLAPAAAGLWPLVRQAAVAAAVMTAWDLVVDPILSGERARAWIWEDGGAYFGIPIQNYLGWLATTFTVYCVYGALERRAAAAPLGPVDRRVAALPVAAYGLMLAADMLTGVEPAGVVVIGTVAMGLPLVASAWALSRYRGNATP